MLWKVFPASLLAILMGIVLGYTPWLNEHLHWNLWYVIPISGLLFGCAAAGLQFGYCFQVNQRIATGIMIFIVLVSVLGYASVDYGIYRSFTIKIEEHEVIPDGEYKLSELISFWQYMKLNLGGAEARTRYGSTIEMGSVAATISYIADLVGSALGAMGVLLLCREKYPFCIRCDRYKEREQKYDVMLKFDEQRVHEIFQDINKLIAERNQGELVEYFQQLVRDHNDAKGNVKISVDQRFCPVCLDATILCTTYRKSGGDWNEIKDLKFVFTSQPGEHVGFGEPYIGQESKEH